jgi:hypothetical protein
MKLKTLMSIKSVICWIFGLGMVILPVNMMAVFGLLLTPAGELSTRLFGAAFIALALWLGLGRDTQEELSRRAVCVAISVSDLIGAVVMTYALLVGVGNVLGWFIVALYLLLAIGFGYVLLAQPEGRLAV